jgi:anti-sigma factor RsiW
MNRHPAPARLEDFLEGLLPPAEADSVQSHLEDCSVCAVELERIEAMFGALAAATIRDPGPALTERILDHVLPSRLRRRWVTALGWAYTTASAVCTFLIVSWAANPHTPVWVTERVAETAMRLTQAGFLAFQAIVFSVLSLATGWSALMDLGARLAPLWRALSAPLGMPVIAATLSAAVVACITLLWWLRPRPTAATKEVRHVPLLGF